MRLMRRNETPLMSRDPWSQEIEEISNRMNRLFGHWPWNFEKESLATTDWMPSVNISETDKAYVIQAELPEVDKKDVHVKLEAGVLTIEGKREQKKEEKGEKFHRVECAYGQFMRQFSMPDDAGETGIKATFKDGMLKVTVPRSEAKKQMSKEIAIS